MKTEHVTYSQGSTQLEACVAYDEKLPGKKPLILIAHDWSGRNQFAEQQAEKMAKLGYIGFAMDVYGKGKLGQTTEEKSALMQPLMQDRALLQQRLLAALESAKKLEQTDTHRIGAIGFCFGGLCVLDLARMNQGVTGVVSFHGLLNAPDNLSPKEIRTKILALHGYQDPMVTPENALTFSQEMAQAKADWQLHIYGQALHAFTNPLAHDYEMGTVYNETAAKRAERAMQAFFKEIF